MSTIKLQDDKDEFISWLQKEKKIGYKSSKDCYYRCLRVEKNIIKSIDLLLSSQEGFVELINLIQQYSVKNTASKEQAYVITGTLRSAVMKYGEFLKPSMVLVYKKRFFCKYL